MNLEDFETRVLPAKNKLYRFAFRLLGSSEEAKDVVQETMIKVWNGRDLAEVQNMEAWCMRITKNLSLDKLRSKQRKSTDSMGEGFEIRQEGLSPHDKTELKESMKRIDELMTQLPDKQRQVMHLRDIEGHSYNEICEILELDMNQVKVNLFRARNAVREKLIKLNAYGLKRIEQLLEKYWNAETSLEEEQELHQFFQGSNVPDNLKEAAPLFRYFQEEKNRSLDKNFDADVTKKIRQRQGGKIVSMTNWFQIARVAAGVAVVVAAVYLIGHEVRKSSPNEITDTESDPKLAFEQTKKALLMISKNFHKAQDEAKKINLLNEAEEKIQRKPEGEKEKKVNI